MSNKDILEKLRLVDYFTANYPYDKEFMKDLLMQCRWSKSQTVKTLEEMMRKEDSTQSPPSQHRKDNATGQKTNSLSPAQKAAPPFKLLDDKSYRQLMGREGVFRFTFFLGEVHFSSEDLRNFAPRVFFESSHLKYLSERLNWWMKLGQYTPLGPLKTRGDGNCLLHAVSRALIGAEDDELVLRGQLHRFLTDKKAVSALKDRWRKQQCVLNGRAGFEFDMNEWGNEWQTVLSLASPDLSLAETPSAPEADTASPSLPYKSLEEIHVFALAHVIRRPIIVLADSVLQDVEGTAMSPVYFGGVYLPLDRNPDECCRIPVVLTYCCSHCAPLVPCYNDLLSPGMSTEGFNEVVVPLVDHRGDMLPIQFQPDQEKKLLTSDHDIRFLSYSKAKLSLLCAYLYVEEVCIPGGKHLVVAKIFPSTHEFHRDIVSSLVSLAEIRQQEYLAKKAREQAERKVKALSLNPPASPRTHGYYSRTNPTSSSASSILPTPIYKSNSAKSDPLYTRASTHYYSTTRQPPHSSTIYSSLYPTVDPLSKALPASTTRLSHNITRPAPSIKPATSPPTHPAGSDPPPYDCLHITKFPTTDIDATPRRRNTLSAYSNTDSIRHPPSTSSLIDHTDKHNKGTNTDFSPERKFPPTYHDPVTNASYRRKDPITSINEPFPMYSKSTSQENLGKRKKEREIYDDHTDKGELLSLVRYFNQ